jgi:1-acyl-sn-glycerol-3-phosphate acyltransferase
VGVARLRLACLWLSQTARALADNCLRMLVILQVARHGGIDAQAAWYQVTPFYILPFLLLAPLNGVLSNRWPKRHVLVGACVANVLTALVLLWELQPENDPRSACLYLMLVMIGSAIYSPARYALLPAVAEDTRIPLARVTGWIETGGAAAVVLGLLWGFPLHDSQMAIPFILGTNLLAVLAALPAEFPSDVCRPEPVGAAVGGFFRDARRIFRSAESRDCLLGLACFMALVVVGTGSLWTYMSVLEKRAPLLLVLLFIALGAAAGSLVASLQGHPRRTLGLVPFGATGMLLALAWCGVTGELGGPSIALGFMGGLVNVPLRTRLQRSVPADARGNAMAVSNAVNYLFIVGLSAILFALAHFEVLGPAGQLALLVGLAALGAAISWKALFRQAFEICVELFFWPCYRVHAHGPGVEGFPLQGPVLVIANHTAWFDPLFVGKALPRRLFPMMTSEFYDLPVVYWIFAHLFEAIRVQAATFRREAPEIRQAIAVLDHGDCLSLFPEGRLRRQPVPLLRKFGRGVWHILRERPDTPVVLCWVEGGYGSFASYFNGKPMQNKRPDFWRRIDVAVCAPQVLPAAILADHRATRTYLMRECLKARAILGLEVPPLPEAGAEKEDEGDEA